ncbi:MAG TPA: aldehyde dehydrogenase family protein [Steroidobacteraceae bacterium]|nr:aldehyde dehydrogenase family protein [Steroidobacteraceae bacterium]
MNAELRSQSPAPANSPSGEDFGLLINGQLVTGAATLNVINPATENIVAVCPRADLDQLNQAVAAAKAAFATWKNVPIQKRRQLVGKLADALESRMSEFARLLTQEQGKPLPAAMHEIGGAVAMIRAFAAMDLKPEVLRETDTARIVRQRSPLGVVAAITPWNFPVVLLMLKVPPALVAGNTVVVKPAPTTPLTTLRFGEICAEVLPPGVVNVIVDQNDLGGALTSHPDVAKVAFTGSTATGRKVMASVAPTLKHVTLELGGNDAAIVLDDVDPKEVAPKLFMGAMLNSGQICLAIKRAYVPDSMYDSVCAELGKLAERAIVGNGLEEGTELGPIQNKMQYEKVKGYLEDARRHGKIVAGGEVSKGRGYFVRPTIVRDIPDDAALVREEQFGPILPVLRYSSLDDAIARANDTEYGLGATVWSSNEQRAYEVASRIESGTVWINKHLDLPPDIPFAGAKQSGLGIEMGQEGLEEFTQQRVINIAK